MRGGRLRIDDITAGSEIAVSDILECLVAGRTALVDLAGSLRTGVSVTAGLASLSTLGELDNLVARLCVESRKDIFVGRESPKYPWSLRPDSSLFMRFILCPSVFGVGITTIVLLFISIASFG